MSVSQVARHLNISRKTVQRYIETGEVEIVEDKRYGPAATGVRFEDVQRVYNKKHPGPKYLASTSCAPVINDVHSFLEDFATDLVKNDIISEAQATTLPKKVLSIYCISLYHVADLDFMAFCIEQLRVHNYTFVLLALGLGEDDAGICEPLVAYAAEKLRETPQEKGYDLGKLSFAGWWKSLVGLCHLKGVWSFEVALVFDTSSQEAVLGLVPKWVVNAPIGPLPMMGGCFSLLRAMKMRGNENVKRIATEAACNLSKKQAEEIRSVIAFCLSLKDESVFKDKNRWNSMELAGSDQKDNPACAVRPDCNGGEYDEFSLYRVIEAAAKHLGLQPDDLRTLVCEWRRLISDISLRIGQRPYSENDSSKQMPERVNIPKTVLADVFGVSRVTITQWLKETPMA